MEEYEVLGHMEQIYENHESGYYTPHHGVITNKFRVVFNASAKTTLGTSLNETQMVGEKLQRDLFLILLNFRKFKFGVIADIEKMYRQILIHRDDRKYQKILWRPSEKEPVRTYQLKTVTYGQACAPHCAIRALMQCAIDHETQFPMGASIVRNCFYVDDLLAGANSQVDLDKIKNEVTSLLKCGGFNITKWKTNGNFHEKIDLSLYEEQSVLGLYWDLTTDQFKFKIKVEESEESIMWTKRLVLSKLGKMYDPNGFIGPVIMKGKIIIQDLWKDKLDWDTQISGVLKERWQHFNKDLTNIKFISLNRWYGLEENKSIQMHGFCDASEKGYGAVVYIRTKRENGYQIELMASKSRVSPLKAITIPRLELCAANLLVNLVESILPIFENKNYRIFCWSDSQVVLQWLKRPSISLKTFVANRVANVQEKNEKFNMIWNWVSGHQNPADLISRGATISELDKNSIWWHGPDWLNKRTSEWPAQPQFFEEQNVEIQNEIKAVHLITETSDPSNKNDLIKGKWFKFDTKKQKDVPLIEAYSSWIRLLRVTATFFRAVYNFKNPKTRQAGILTDQEKEMAHRYLITIDQEKTFPKEFEITKTNNRGTLANLVILFDKEYNCVRLDGRVRSSNLTRDEQFPIILNKGSRISHLLIKYAHLQTKHGGNQLTAQYLRKKYWIIGAKRSIKNVIRKCQICFKLRMKTSEQLMASLPNYRTSPQRAFKNVGVDYAGPFTVRSALGRLPKLTKAWIAVFVCLVTRAIHLELVSQATTQAFIAALKRMISRRGIVKEIVSDNGTNFVGANNFLKSVVENIRNDQNKLEEEFQFQWHFVTSRAPHHGGIYEAAVKTVKHHLTRVIGDTTLTFEEYATILCQIEACVNSRPLCPLSEDPTDLNALTPGHFLIGEPIISIPDEEDFRKIPENRLDRWNHLQKMIQHFWERWHNEYIGTIINRTKWLKEKRNLRIGDLVVVKDENLPPTKWKLGRIEQVLPGKDELVRSVIVRTATGIYARPIVKLGLITNSEEE